MSIHVLSVKDADPPPTCPSLPLFPFYNITGSACAPVLFVVVARPLDIPLVFAGGGAPKSRKRRLFVSAGMSFVLGVFKLGTL